MNEKITSLELRILIFNNLLTSDNDETLIASLNFKLVVAQVI